MDTKKCRKCGQYKELVDFHVKNASKDGRQSSCKPCNQKTTEEWQLNNSEKFISNWKSKIGNESEILKRKSRLYGLNLEELSELYNSTDSCMICGIIPSNGLHIDHDHITGNVRGLLCMSCNTALGSFKDSISDLENAIKYLKN